MGLNYYSISRWGYWPLAPLEGPSYTLSGPPPIRSDGEFALNLVYLMLISKDIHFTNWECHGDSLHLLALSSFKFFEKHLIFLRKPCIPHSGCMCLEWLNPWPHFQSPLPSAPWVTQDSPGGIIHPQAQRWGRDEPLLQMAQLDFVWGGWLEHLWKESVFFWGGWCLDGQECEPEIAGGWSTSGWEEPV